MISKLVRPLTDAEVQEYQENGVVYLPQVIDVAWVEKARHAIQEVIDNPGPRRIEGAEDGGRFAIESGVWQRNAKFHDFIFESPAAAIAARILRSDKVNLLYDQMLVKEPGTSVPTSWHQDGASWPVHGENICTIWMGLDEVTQESGGMKYLKGGHLGKRYGSYVNVVKHTPDAVNLQDARCPDYDTVPGSEVVHWDVIPGDVLIHHMWMPHSAGGNFHSDRRRRAYTTRWAADDVKFQEGNFQFRPPASSTLKDGDPLDSEFFPAVPFEKSWN